MVIYRRNRQGKAENLLLVADRGSLIALYFPFSCNRRLLLPISFLILFFTVALLPPILEPFSGNSKVNGGGHHLNGRLPILQLPIFIFS